MPLPSHPSNKFVLTMLITAGGLMLVSLVTTIPRLSDNLFSLDIRRFANSYPGTDDREAARLMEAGNASRERLEQKAAADEKAERDTDRREVERLKAAGTRSQTILDNRQPTDKPEKTGDAPGATTGTCYDQNGQALGRDRCFTSNTIVNGKPVLTYHYNTFVNGHWVSTSVYGTDLPSNFAFSNDNSGVHTITPKPEPTRLAAVQPTPNPQLPQATPAPRPTNPPYYLQSSPTTAPRPTSPPIGPLAYRQPSPFPTRARVNEFGPGPTSAPLAQGRVGSRPAPTQAPPSSTVTTPQYLSFSAWLAQNQQYWNAQNANRTYPTYPSWFTEPVQTGGMIDNFNPTFPISGMNNAPPANQYGRGTNTGYTGSYNAPSITLPSTYPRTLPIMGGPAPGYTGSFEAPTLNAGFYQAGQVGSLNYHISVGNISNIQCQALRSCQR